MVRAWWDQTHTHTHTNIRKQTTTGEIITALVAGAKQQQESAENDTAFFNTIVKQNKYLQRKQRNSCETINVISILHPSVTQSVLLCYFFLQRNTSESPSFVLTSVVYWNNRWWNIWYFTDSFPQVRTLNTGWLEHTNHFHTFFFYLGTITCFDR